MKTDTNTKYKIQKLQQELDDITHRLGVVSKYKAFERKHETSILKNRKAEVFNELQKLKGCG